MVELGLSMRLLQRKTMKCNDSRVVVLDTLKYQLKDREELLSFIILLHFLYDVIDGMSCL